MNFILRIHIFHDSLRGYWCGSWLGCLNHAWVAKAFSRINTLGCWWYKWWLLRIQTMGAKPWLEFWSRNILAWRNTPWALSLENSHYHEDIVPSRRACNGWVWKCPECRLEFRDLGERREFGKKRAITSLWCRYMPPYSIRVDTPSGSALLGI